MAAVLLLGTPGLARAAAALATGPEVQAQLLEGVLLNHRGLLDDADRVWEAFREAHPQHPAGPLFQASTVFWRQTFDESNRKWDARLEALSSEGLALAEAWLATDPQSPEALLYRGQARMQRARMELARGSYLAAGREGEKGRNDLEAALRLDPTLHDARHHLGLYYYYAGVLPSVLKWLNFLWFIPKGDQAKGLAYLEQARRDGPLTRHDASFILLNVHTYFEKDGKGRAFQLARELHARFPESSLLHFELIEVLAALEDWKGVRREAAALEASQGTSESDVGRRMVARVWRAGAELSLGEPETAWQTLQVFADDMPEDPLWASAWIQLTRARVLDVLGKREQAVDEYEQVIALEPPRASRRASALAEEGLAKPFELPRLPEVSAVD